MKDNSAISNLGSVPHVSGWEQWPSSPTLPHARKHLIRPTPGNIHGSVMEVGPWMKNSALFPISTTPHSHRSRTYTHIHIHTYIHISIWKVQKGFWNLSVFFVCWDDEGIFILYSINMVFYTNWFLDAKLTLRSWNKIYSVMVYNPFYMLLDSCCKSGELFVFKGFFVCVSIV